MLYLQVACSNNFVCMYSPHLQQKRLHVYTTIIKCMVLGKILKMTSDIVLTRLFLILAILYINTQEYC